MKRYIALIVLGGIVLGGIPIFGVVYVVSIRESAIIHRAPAGAYRMAVPRKCLFPSNRTRSFPSPVGDVESIEKTRMVFGNTAVGFGLIRIVFPPQVLASRLPEDTLATCMQGVGADMHGTQGAPNRIQYEGWPGLECTFDGKFKGVAVFGRIRTYQIDKDVVVLMAMGDEASYKDDPNWIRYLDTFTFAPGSAKPIRKSVTPSVFSSPRASRASASASPAPEAAPAPTPARKPPPVDPATLQGKTLAEVKEMLGKPPAEIKMGTTVIWNYNGLRIVSSDGVRVTSVSLQ